MNFIIISLCEFDWSIFANVIAAFANVGVLILGLVSIKYVLRQVKIAQDQIQQTKKITEADIIIRINSNFFTEKTKDLFFLIENDLLKYFHTDDESNNIDYYYFEIDKLKISKYPNLKEFYSDSKNNTFYTCSDIEHLLLNNFEDLGIMRESNLIKNELIKQNFSYYIVNTCNKSSINQYLKSIRIKDNELYSHVVKLYNEFKSINDPDL